MPKISAPPSVFAKALTLMHQLLGFFTSSAAFLSYSVVSPIRFSISICSDHLLREISVLLLYSLAGAVCNRKLYSLVLSCTHHGKTRVGKIRLFVVLRMGYDSILVFNLFSYLFVQDLPVQGNPVQVNAVVVKQKSPESGEFRVVLGWTSTTPMHRECAQTGASLAAPGAVCGNVAGWVCIQLLARE